MDDTLGIPCSTYAPSPATSDDERTAVSNKANGRSGSGAAAVRGTKSSSMSMIEDSRNGNNNFNASIGHEKSPVPPSAITMDENDVVTKRQRVEVKNGGVGNLEEDDRKKLFPEKLHEIITNKDEDPMIALSITWDNHGRSFRVLNSKVFEQEVLSQHFKCTKMKSCVRQLNLYKFMRVRKGKDQGSYYHPHFLRGCPQMAEQIRRSSKKNDEDNSVPDFYSLPSAEESPFPHSLPGSGAGFCNTMQKGVDMNRMNPNNMGQMPGFSHRQQFNDVSAYNNFTPQDMYGNQQGQFVPRGMTGNMGIHMGSFPHGNNPMKYGREQQPMARLQGQGWNMDSYSQISPRVVPSMPRPTFGQQVMHFRRGDNMNMMDPHMNVGMGPGNFMKYGSNVDDDSFHCVPRNFSSFGDIRKRNVHVGPGDNGPYENNGVLAQNFNPNFSNEGEFMGNGGRDDPREFTAPESKRAYFFGGTVTGCSGCGSPNFNCPCNSFPRNWRQGPAYSDTKLKQSKSQLDKEPSPLVYTSVDEMSNSDQNESYFKDMF